MSKPSVLFICQKNGGKSQMAAALARLRAGDSIAVYSAGTKPGQQLNEESRSSIAAAGGSFAGEYPKPIDPEFLASVDRVIIIGQEAEVSPPPHMNGTLERWVIDEPSLRGIAGAERMKLIRDELEQKVQVLLSELRSA